MAALLAGTALVGVAGFNAVSNAATPNDTPITPPVTSAGLADFSGLVTQVKPAVVSITTQLRPDAEQQQGIETPFGMLRPQHPRAVEARGSGFIIDSSGTIVTNNHMVRDARSVSVTLDDGTQLPAKIIGRDPRTDLAVIKIDAGHKLPYLQLGDSDQVKPGQWVVAMGNPFGLGGTVTAGIVSARGRDIGSGPYDDFLQIDAPINQGNSGGPLFTQNGQVVGVNTAILSPSGGSVGIGFAIPSAEVKSVVAQLEKNGHVTRGFLGVESQSVDSAMASALHLPGHPAADNGALVASVSPDSPASKGGLQPGDVIQAVNGKHVGTPRDLAVDIAEVVPGQDAKLDVVRDGATQTITVPVTTMPNQQTADRGDNGGQQGVGLALAPLSPDMRNQLDVPTNAQGAVVAQVEPDSPAAAAGIRQGDVIMGVGEKSVKSVDEAVSAIHAAEKSGSAIALRVMRDGHPAFVALNLTKAGTSGDTNSDQDDSDSGNG
ncbi:MAG TPA: Do family serine endopeptidase [Acetobacteraceae bacterium]